jgi:hypothetical protein
MYNRPNGRGGFVATDMSGAGVPKNALRVPCRRYPYFFGNKSVALDPDRDSGVRLMSALDKCLELKYNTTVRNGGLHDEDWAALCKCACGLSGCERELFGKFQLTSLGRHAGMALQEDRAAYVKVHGDTGDGPHWLMHPACAEQVLAAVAAGQPRPRKSLMPLAGPQPSAPLLQLTDRTATAAAPAAPAAHGGGAGGMTPRAGVPGSVSVSPDSVMVKADTCKKSSSADETNCGHLAKSMFEIS